MANINPSAVPHNNPSDPNSNPLIILGLSRPSIFNEISLSFFSLTTSHTKIFASFAVGEEPKPPEILVEPYIFPSL